MSDKYPVTHDQEDRNEGIELEFSLGLDSEHSKFPVVICETEYSNLNGDMVPFRAEINEDSFKRIQETIKNGDLDKASFVDVSNLHGSERLAAEQAIKYRELAIINAEKLAAIYAEGLIGYAMRGVDDPTLKGRLADQILEKAREAIEREKQVDQQPSE